MTPFFSFCPRSSSGVYLRGAISVQRALWTALLFGVVEVAGDAGDCNWGLMFSFFDWNLLPMIPLDGGGVNGGTRTACELELILSRVGGE